MDERLFNFFRSTRKNILLENEASNTTENVLASTLVLQKEIGLNKLNRILVVSTPCHIKRCFLTLKTYMPDWINYTLCPDGREYGQKDNWWMVEIEKERVLKEVRSIVLYVNAGILNDEIINV